MMKFCALVLCVGVVAADITGVLEFQDTVGTCKIQKDDGTLNLDCDTVIDNKLKVGNSISNLWSVDLPVGVDMIRTTPDGRCCGGSAPYSSDSGDYASGPCADVSGCGYATGKLHMKTNMLCANPANAMYHLEFRGHLFVAKKAFFCEAVGYLAAAGLTHTNAACHHAPSDIYHDMGISTYCTTDGYLAFALTDPTTDGNLWHASDIVVNYVGGSGNYVARGSLLEITESAISPLDEEFCGGAYCDYDINYVDVDSSLIAKFEMEGNGADSSGNGYSATQNGGSFSASGVGGAGSQAFEVSGCNDMQVDGLKNHDWGSDFSVCTWFKRTSDDGNYQGIISTGYGSNGKWEIRMGREDAGTMVGGMIFPSTDAAGDWNFGSGSPTRLNAALNSWNHVCMTWDGSVSNYFLNGVLSESSTDSANAGYGDSGSLGSTPNPVFIGRAGTGTSGECFTGLIDNVRLYSKAVNQAEVTELYNGLL